MLAGCGTTRWTDSPRTATELLLISDAIDCSVDRFDFRGLAGKTVYFESKYLAGTTDERYIVSSLRQKLLSSGCLLKENRDEADYVVEARSGGVGTNRQDVMLGIPSVSVPPFLPITGGIPASIPELPFIKNTNQKAVAKLAVFAYQRETGRAVWQSGAVPMTSMAKHTWILGAGPFQRGSIYKGTKFAGEKLKVPRVLPMRRPDQEVAKEVSVTARALFDDPGDEPDSQVQQARHEEEVPERPKK